MKSKMHVFVSYSRLDNPLFESLKMHLKSSRDVLLKTDVHDIKAGEPVHKKIAEIIDWTHIVIPIVTKNWLNSHETRDELIRATERRKYIIPLVEKGVFYDKKLTLPHYLIDDNQIRFDSSTFSDAISSVLRSILDYKPVEWKQKIYKDVALIGGYVENHKNSLLYQQEYSKSLIESSGKELMDVLARNSFEIEIGLEKNFLNRALPIFSSAKKIYAVSVADISSFWVSENNKALTLKFLDAQKNDEVYRLFVFSSPEQVVRYKNVLQANYRAYGANGGGIFICSYETYIKFMESFKSHNIFISEKNQQDFGVFIFDSQVPGCEDEYVEGILDSNALRFRAFSLSDIKSTSYLQFVRAMENLSIVDCGKYSSDYDIYRWCPNLYEDPVLFSEVLSKLFDEAHEKIYHYLFIKGDESVGDVLHQLCCKFRDHKKDLRIMEANVYKTTAVNAIDGNYGGVIRIGGVDFEHYNYIFIVEFEDKKALEHYYNHKLHSAEREILYKSINADVVPLYDKINTILKYKDISYNKMIEIYGQIEEVMKGFVLRVDIQKSMPLIYMCMQKGIPIGDFNH